MPYPTPEAMARDLKQKILTCITKLSDRDTFPSAANELETIAKTIPPSSISLFLSSISPTDPSDKTPVRKHPLLLISLLCITHQQSLLPHISKLISAVLVRLRDNDSSVRLACVEMVKNVAVFVKPGFSVLVKPLENALFMEQEVNAQMGSALCLSMAIDSCEMPDLVHLGKLVSRLEKLLKSNSFKAKGALLGVFRSVIGVGLGLGRNLIRNILGCFLDYLGSEDWAVRKAAAEALVKLAGVERDRLSDFKAVGLKTIEAKRYDKVKIVRETMNQLVEAWKEIPDITTEVSPPMEPISSSKEEASDGRYPPGSRNITSFKKNTPSTTTTGPKRTSLDSSDKRSPAMFRKLDRKKPTHRKSETATPPSSTVAGEDTRTRRDVEKDGKVPSRFAKLETRRALFIQNEHPESTVVSNVTEDIKTSQEECEDLSLIYKQLGQIETQQANLLNLLQKFMGSTQTGLRALETRVHGLELTLDEISYDLSVSTKGMPNSDSKGTGCCKLPGAEFLSPKFWRKTEPRHSISQFSSSKGMSIPLGATRERSNKYGNADDAFNPENRRLRMQGRNGFIVNPLADLHNDSHGISEVPSN